MNSPISFVFIFVFVIHFVIAILSCASFFPSFGTRNKTPAQIDKDKEYCELFSQNFPFLSFCSIIFFFLFPVFYIIISLIEWNIEFIDQPLSAFAGISLIIISLTIMILLIIIVGKEYLNRDSKIKKEHHFIGIGIFIFIYSFSILLGNLTVHLLNPFDFFTGEEHIVTITKSEQYTTRGSKGRTSNHYVIHFEPHVCGYTSLRVSKSFQEKAKEKDQLKIYVKNGLFGIPFLSSNKILINKQ